MAKEPPPVDARQCTLRIGPGADLQRTIDRLPENSTPATICLGAGDFRLPRFLSITRDAVDLRGEGPSTVLRLEAGAQSPVIVVGDHFHQVPARAVSHVTVERLRIVGAGRDGSESDPEHPYLQNSAIAVRAGREIVLRDLDISACRSACLLTEHDSRDVTIEHNTISGSTWDGISLNRTVRARLVRNTIRDNTAAGITAEHLEDSVIERNVISGNRSQGVYLADSYRNRFSGNRFTANVNAGVFLTCAVRYRDPGPVLCWVDSMSQGNAFEDNEFRDNRQGYIVAPDAAANCRKAGIVPNVSRGDRFEGGPRVEQQRDTYGECLRLVAPAALRAR